MAEDIINRIRKTVRENGMIEKGGHIVLGLSGGPDSMCLFDALLALSDELRFTMEAVHVNHMLRPGDAEDDMRFVEEVCAEAGVRLTVVTEDCGARAEEWGMTSEEAGRVIRYGAFEDAAGKYAAKHPECPSVAIAVAHNMNDQAETVLFRLMRGTGTDGLAGIDYVRPTPNGYNVVRPLLDCARPDIERYCEDNGLRPREDKTNSEPVYTRNRIRNGLIPYIEENFNSNIIEGLARLAASARDDRDCLNGAAEGAFAMSLIDAENDEIILYRDSLIDMKRAVRHRVIILALGRIGLYRDITAKHIATADAVIESGAASGTAEFTGGYRMISSYDRVIFRAPGDRSAAAENESELNVRIIPADQYDGQCGSAAFDLDLLSYGTGGAEKRLRTRMPGDFIALPGMKGRKKIQDLFVDMKIPAEERDSVELICAGHEVLFVAGDAKTGRKPRYSGNYRVSDKTERVVILEISE